MVVFGHWFLKNRCFFLLNDLFAHVLRWARKGLVAFLRYAELPNADVALYDCE
jgi:hypothetical protein